MVVLPIYVDTFLAFIYFNGGLLSYKVGVLEDYKEILVGFHLFPSLRVLKIYPQHVVLNKLLKNRD